MKLKDILNGSPVNITYRTDTPFEKDMLAGACHWTGSELVSIDKDDYSVEDEISRYAWVSPDELIVWYKSKWI